VVTQQREPARQPGAEPATVSLRPFRQAGRAGIAAQWVVGAAALWGLAAGVVAWARTRPGYDPYGWLVWGHQALQGTLNLGGAPSWKPLPFLFTAPFALTGTTERWLWEVTSLALALSGCVFAARLAWRLTSDSAVQAGIGRGAGLLLALAAAAVAGLGVLEIQTIEHYMLSYQSDPVITALCLAAADCALAARGRWALAALTLAALGRPEVWAFLAVFTLWAWLRRPALRPWSAAAIGLVAALWFGVPWLTNGRPGLAGQLAENTRQVLRSAQLSGTWSRFVPLHEKAIWLVALVGVIIGLLRRNVAILLLAGGVVLWFAVEVLTAYVSLPVLPRFMFEAAGLAAVVAGAGLGTAGVEIAALGRRLPLGPGLAGLLAVGSAAALLVPAAGARTAEERGDLDQLHRRSAELALLSTAIQAAGGPELLRSCGEPVTYVSDASALAWLLGLDVARIGYKPGREIRRGIPLVILRPLDPTGWTLTPVHERGGGVTRCARLRTSALTPLTGPGSPDDGAAVLPTPAAPSPATSASAASGPTTTVGRPAPSRSAPARPASGRPAVSTPRAAARASFRRSRARSGSRLNRRSRSPGEARSRSRRRRSRSRR
jgi:hypothetical protein